MNRSSDDPFLRIGKKIREIRTSRGLNTNVAYEIRQRYQVKIDPSYLSRMERGKAEIPLRTLFALADFYDINPGELLDREWVNSSIKGLERFLNDRELIQGMDEMKNRLGESKARDHLKRFINQTISLLKEGHQSTGGSNNSHSAGIPTRSGGSSYNSSDTHSTA